jgi:S1-C subfamily serine protease
MPLDEDPDDDLSGFGPPLPPEDRLWRHPSELSQAPLPGPPAIAPGPVPAPLRTTWLVAGAAGMIGALLSLGVVAATGTIGRTRIIEHDVVEKVATVPASLQGSRDTGVADIAERIRPSICRLDVTTAKGDTTGSGVLFRDDGYLLTNAHVVASSTKVRVVLGDGRMYDGTIVGTDAYTDLAVVRISTADKVPVAVLGSALRLRVGEPAMAIGSPLGLPGGPSVTEGVISAVGRQVTNPSGPTLHDMLQTDAPIAPGSSGGALVDTRGAVIGIMTALALSDAGNQGFGFAVPIDIAHTVAEEIIATGKARHVWLGVEGGDLDGATAQQLGVAGGATVQRVLGDSPAALAGIRVGDVIVAVADQPVVSMSGLVVALRTRHPGDDVRLTYLRDGRRRTATVTLGERS